MMKRTKGVLKKEVLVKEKEDNWYISPCRGIPEYSSDKDPHCPTGQIRKFNEEKRLKAEILAQREKATASFVKTTLDHSVEEISLDLDGSFGKTIKDMRSKVKTVESYVEIEILQKIVVRENLLAELQKLLKTQNDVSSCLTEIVELVKAIRFQTLDVIEDIKDWQHSLPAIQPFQFKGFNYLVKIKSDLDFLDYYEEIVERFGFEFRSNPLAYRGGGHVISGYGNDTKNKKSYSQGLLQSYYSENDQEFLNGLEVYRLQEAEKIVQREFDRIAKEKSAGRELTHLQNQGSSNDVLSRDIFNAISKSATSLPELGSGPNSNDIHEDDQPHTTDGSSFPVGNTKKKSKKVKKGPIVVTNPKRAKQERIATLTEEASDLKAMMVNVEEKIKFLTNHHLDLLNQRATLDSRLKEAKAMARESTAQHIAAEISVNTAVIADNSTKIKDLQRESYFINLERKRKLGTVHKLKEEIEEAKRRASLQKKIEAKIKKEGLLAALQSFNTKASVEEIATLGDKALGKRPTSASATSRGSPPRSAGRNSRGMRNTQESNEGGNVGGDKKTLSNSVSAPVFTHARSLSPTTDKRTEYWTKSPTRGGEVDPVLILTEDDDAEGDADGAHPSLREPHTRSRRKGSHNTPPKFIEYDNENTMQPATAATTVESGNVNGDNTANRSRNLSFYDEDIGAEVYDVSQDHADDDEEEDDEEEEEEQEEEEENEEEEREQGCGGNKDEGDLVVEEKVGGRNLGDGEIEKAQKLGENANASVPPSIDVTAVTTSSDKDTSHSPVKFSGRSQSEYPSSPSDASLDGSNLSPLAYSYYSASDADDHHHHQEHHHSKHANKSRAQRDSTSVDRLVSTGNDMYISDDDDGNVSELEKSGHHERSPIPSYVKVKSSASPVPPTLDTSSEVRPLATNGEKEHSNISNISDLSVSPHSLGSTVGFLVKGDSYISNAPGSLGSGGSEISPSNHPPTSSSDQATDGKVLVSDSIISSDISRKKLFVDADQFGAAEDNAMDGDYPAGGAYALVKSLKLSPRPN